MTIHSSALSAIGNTPLIRLKAASEATGCEILGKAEFLNPGQSVKDRAALYIIRDAERRGQLRPGGTIVEGTAGNTGIGLSLVANALGYKTVIVIPETQSQEKKDALKLLGAKLVEVPAAPYSNPNNYVKVSGRLAKQLAATDENGAIWANQFDNIANRQAHIETTAPEIWDQTDGKVDGFICSVGSGGTLAGVADGLRDFNPDIKIGLADPEGAALYEFYKHGVLKSEGSSITEGIGRGASPPIWKASRRISPIVFRMRKRCRCCSIWSRKKACASAVLPASTLPAQSALPVSSVRGIPS